MKLLPSVYESIIHASHDAIIVIDAKGKICLWNKSAEELFGYTETFMLGKDMHDYITPERYREMAKKALEHYQHSGEGNAIGKLVEIEGLTQSGAEIWIELGLTSLQLEGKFWSFAIIRDINEKKQNELTLREAAETDSLTGLTNRRSFQSTLETHISKDLCLAIIDIDFFKQINDKYGHLAGDEALQALSQLIKTEFKEMLCLARLGGEEFGVLIHTSDSSTLFDRCEAFRLKVPQIELTNPDIKMTVSIGIADGTTKPRTLFSRADVALYKAKESGRNQTILSEV